MRYLRQRAELKAASMWSVEQAVGIFEDAWRIWARTEMVDAGTRVPRAPDMAI